MNCIYYLCLLYNRPPLAEGNDKWSKESVEYSDKEMGDFITRLDNIDISNTDEFEALDEEITMAVKHYKLYEDVINKMYKYISKI